MEHTTCKQPFGRVQSRGGADLTPGIFSPPAGHCTDSDTTVCDQGVRVLGTSESCNTSPSLLLRVTNVSDSNIGSRWIRTGIFAKDGCQGFWPWLAKMCKTCTHAHWSTEGKSMECSEKTLKHIFCSREKKVCSCSWKERKPNENKQANKQEKQKKVTFFNRQIFIVLQQWLNKRKMWNDIKNCWHQGHVLQFENHNISIMHALEFCFQKKTNWTSTSSTTRIGLDSGIPSPDAHMHQCTNTLLISPNSHLIEHIHLTKKETKHSAVKKSQIQFVTHSWKIDQKYVMIANCCTKKKSHTSITSRKQKMCNIQKNSWSTLKWREQLLLEMGWPFVATLLLDTTEERSRVGHHPGCAVWAGVIRSRPHSFFGCGHHCGSVGPWPGVTRLSVVVEKRAVILRPLLPEPVEASGFSSGVSTVRHLGEIFHKYVYTVGLFPVGIGSKILRVKLTSVKGNGCTKQRRVAFEEGFQIVEVEVFLVENTVYITVVEKAVENIGVPNYALSLRLELFKGSLKTQVEFRQSGGAGAFFLGSLHPIHEFQNGKILVSFGQFFMQLEIFWKIGGGVSFVQSLVAGNKHTGLVGFPTCKCFLSSSHDSLVIMHQLCVTSANEAVQVLVPVQDLVHLFIHTGTQWLYTTYGAEQEECHTYLHHFHATFCRAWTTRRIYASTHAVGWTPMKSPPCGVIVPFVFCLVA